MTHVQYFKCSEAKWEIYVRNRDLNQIRSLSLSAKIKKWDL